PGMRPNRSIAVERAGRRTRHNQTFDFIRVDAPRLKSGGADGGDPCIQLARLGSQTLSQCAANTLSTNFRADSPRLKVSARARASSLGIERAASAARPRFA